MAIQQVSVTKMRTNFECEKCENTVHWSISEAISNGPPVCPNCNIKMKLVDAEIRSQMVFA